VAGHHSCDACVQSGVGVVLPPLDEIYFSHFYKLQSLAFEQRALLLLAASRALDDAKLLTERELF
jgi:hypothetical protein